MLEPQYETWPANAANLQHMCDPTGSRPWAPSPELVLFPLPSAPQSGSPQPVIPDIRRRENEGRRKLCMHDDPFKRQSPRSWPLRLARRWFGKKRPKDVQRVAEDWPSLRESRHIVTPAEWRAYGYWARPAIGHITVHNATPISVPRNLSRREVEDVFRSVVDSQGQPHPENWIPRVQHPALPPRPALWSTPPSSPRPLAPSEIQLNPFLRHRPYGRPPILFDMRLHTCTVLLGEIPPDEGDTVPWQIPFYADGPNGCQPATYPPVSSLLISTLADDTFAKFPWRFIVQPHHPRLPVLVKDVINAVIYNFEQRMEAEEVNALSPERRKQVFRTYWERVRTMVGGRIPGDDDGLRRIDYLGDQAFFRGLEPAPDGAGFMMFVGSP